MSVSIRLGVVQPQAHGENAAPKMLKDALAYIASASDARVDLLLFPELYPGPVVITCVTGCLRLCATQQPNTV